MLPSAFRARLRLRSPGSKGGIFFYLAVLASLITFAVLLYVGYVVYQLFYPTCQSVLGRVCNEQGTCLNGVCRCNPLFSGEVCTKTRIPGYDISTNLPCGGHGYASENITVPDACLEVVINGRRSGPGWGSPGCISYVTAIQQAVVNNGGNPVGVPLSYTVPLCLCHVRYGGLECKASACPVDENGGICGLHGNTSVGLVSNYTDPENTGCQCINPVNFVRPPYRQYISPSERERNSLLLSYTFCGTVTLSPVNTILFSSAPNNFRCYCADGWGGPVCTEKNCPDCSNSNLPCCGHGHPAYGQGLLLDSSAPAPGAKIRCVNDTETCGLFSGDTPYGRCVGVPDPLTPVMDRSLVCAVPSLCPADKYVRCPTGGCVAAEPFQEYRCTLGYQEGSVDLGRINILIQEKTCANLSSLGEVTSCFQNTTELPAVVGYNLSGLTLNVSATPITLNLGSPLIYYQFYTDALSVAVETWDGQTTIQDGPGYITGSFAYPTEGKWISIGEGEYSLYPREDHWNLCPMPWNYTDTELYPANFTRVRASSPERNWVVVFDAFSAYLNVTDYATGTAVLVASAGSVSEPLYWYPDGREVPAAFCLSNPASCAFYLDETASQLRSMDSSWYVCSQSDTPVLTQEPCGLDFSELLSAIPTYLKNFETCLEALTTVPIDAGVNSFTFLEGNYTQRSSWPFNITLTGSGGGVFFSSPAFLTLSDVTFPCSCPIPANNPNASTLNNQWWDQRTLREVRYDLVSVGDYVLAAEISSGEAVLQRCFIVEIDEVADTLLVENYKTGNRFSVYTKNARTISLQEVVRGIPTPTPIISPFKCPDGTGTPVEILESSVPTSCNCTYNAPIANCSCSDPYPNYFGADCNTTLGVCQSGYPGDPWFSQELSRKLDNLLNRDCKCLFYTPSQADLTNSTVEVTDIDAYEYAFNYTLDQVVTHLVLKTTGGNCNQTSFSLSGLSELFRELAFTISYTDSVQGDCEHWLTLYMPQDPALTGVLVRSNDTLSWGAMIFSTAGFSLNQLDPSPTFTASSNSASAGNVNVLNSSFWESSTLHSETLPYIAVQYSEAMYSDYTTVTFYEAGFRNATSGANYPQRIYLQGWLNGNWYNVVSFGVYVARGGWKTVSAVYNATTPFERYRLISQAPFAVRSWQLFANQVCPCTDGTILSIKVLSFDGLSTLEDQLDAIRYWQRVVGGPVNASGQLCVCENNCELQTSPGIYIDAAGDGICEDALCVASALGVVQSFGLISTTNVTIALNSSEVTELIPGSLGAVQFANDSSLFLNSTELLEYYTNGDGASNAFYYLGLLDNSTSIYRVYYFNWTTLEIFQSPIVNVTTNPAFWLNNTFILQFLVYGDRWGSLVSSGLACAPGWDCADSGPYPRGVLSAPGLGCSLTLQQQTLLDQIANGTTQLNRTYVVANLSQVTNWTAYFQSIQLTRNESLLAPRDCPIQTCPVETPFLCASGRCVRYPSGCALRYDIPGNGCVQLVDASRSGNDVYRCACAPGYAGASCSFHETRGAIPSEQYAVSVYQETMCGGPPPLTEKPPCLNEGRDLTLAQLVALDARPKGTCAKRSARDPFYACIMPQFAPFGCRVKYRLNMTTGGVSGIGNNIIYTDCPPARRGYYGEYYLIYDDAVPSSINPITGEVGEWKLYYNPFKGIYERFPWATWASYNDFPYRGPNGQCLPSAAYIAQSVTLFPACNGRGTCLADGSCQCYPGWKTNLINQVYSERIRYPYSVVDGVPNPISWTINWNWKHHGLNQCTARDCAQVDCTAPVGCRPGTRKYNFRDSYVFCDHYTTNPGRCAPTLDDCFAGTNLLFPQVCSGNGIPRTKDFSGEEYCACGTPISGQDISSVYQITQLLPNGWGGPNCDQYEAQVPPAQWSPKDYNLDEPYVSFVTGRELPGRPVAGICIVGPDPDDKALWDQCCPGVDRLEDCGVAVCELGNTVKCVPFDQCVTPWKPKVPPCNGHGLCRGDGTCECDYNAATGVGYTFDHDQFDYDGCYKKVSCPISTLSGTPCNTFDAVQNPQEWRHPLPYDPFLEQQWFTCPGVTGEYSNSTILNFITPNNEQFFFQLLDALAEIALRVIAAEDDLAACICVYPNDTVSEKYGMLPGSSYTYMQNYKAAYDLAGRTPYNFLTDGILESRLTPGEYVILSTGDTLTFTLYNNDSTTLSAIRLWALAYTNSTTVRFLSGGEQVCVDGLLTRTSEGGTTTMGWAVGDNDDALYCGPTYECDPATSSPEYGSFCRDPTSENCIAWKESWCVSNPENVYWPLDSRAIYENCNRDDEKLGEVCTCCTRLTVNPYPAITSANITLQVISGSLALGQVRYYGFTSRALTVVDGLKEYLDTAVGFETTCQDNRFYTAILGADGSYYVPDDDILSRESAKTMCNDTGGWLAVTDNLVQNGDAGPNVQALVAACSRIGGIRNNNPTCWVNAQSTIYNDTTASRDELFTGTCGTLGCYNTTLRPMYNFPDLLGYVFTFSTYPDTPSDSNLYKEPTFSATQLNSFTRLTSFTQSAGNLYTDFFNPDVKRYDAPWNQCVLQFLTQLGWTTVLRGTDVKWGQVIQLDGNLASWNTMLFDQGLGGVGLDAGETTSCGMVSFYVGSTCDLNFIGSDNGVYPPAFIFSASTVGRGPVLPRSPNEGPFPSYGNPSWSSSSILNLQRMCIRVFPAQYIRTASNGARIFSTSRVQTLTRWRVNGTPNARETSGTFGSDFWPSIGTFPFMPVFLEANCGGPNSYFLDPIVPFYLTSLGCQPSFTFGASPMRYFEQVVSYFTSSDPMSAIPVAPVAQCNSCLVHLGSAMQWDQLTYDIGSWAGSFSLPGKNILIYVRKNTLDSSYEPLELRPITVFSHLVTFIESLNLTRLSYARSVIAASSDSWLWKLGSCLAVDARGPVLTVCGPDVQHNLVCQYDFTKYTVLSGYQCPPCGCSTRRGGLPIPGLTCFADNPLANATAFPLQHQIKDQYRAGTLSLYAESYNPPSETSLAFGNKSILWGFPQCYEAWAKKVNTRLPVGVAGSQLNWVSLSLPDLWPVNCGRQFNSTSGRWVRFLALSAEFCPLDAVLPEPSPIRAVDVPPVLGPVSPTESLTNPTCGPTLYLREYIQVNKYGGAQTDLELYSVLVESTYSYVELQALVEEPLWYNGGKTNSRYVFDVNVTATISGSVLPSDACVMEVFIHPLNIEYTYPTYLIAKRVTLSAGVLQSWSLNFTVNETQAGTYTANGQTFPERVFRGVGFRFIGLTPRVSTVRLYNPVITDDDSRAVCIARRAPVWYNQKARIESTAPDNICVIDSESKKAFPDQLLGTCGCAQSQAGRSCDCPAVLSSYGKKVCGYYGDSSSAVLRGGEVVLVGEGTEEGCFIHQGKADCKTVDLGRAAYTLQVPGAIWDYPSVFVDAPPASDRPLFINPINTLSTEFAFDGMETECLLESSMLPYYFTGDELNQLVRTNIRVLPLFMGVRDQTPSTWPWISNVDGAYMVYNNSGVEFMSDGLDGDCTANSVSIGICAAANFNNRVYRASTTTPCLVDGNTVSSCVVGASTYVNWTAIEVADQYVTVYLFGGVGGGEVLCEVGSLTTSCGGGTVFSQGRIYECNCPERTIQIISGTYTEVQVFVSTDNIRSSTYSYT